MVEKYKIVGLQRYEIKKLNGDYTQKHQPPLEFESQIDAQRFGEWMVRKRIWFYYRIKKKLK